MALGRRRDATTSKSTSRHFLFTVVTGLRTDIILLIAFNSGLFAANLMVNAEGTVEPCPPIECPTPWVVSNCNPGYPRACGEFCKCERVRYNSTASPLVNVLKTCNGITPVWNNVTLQCTAGTCPPPPTTTTPIPPPTTAPTITTPITTTTAPPTTTTPPPPTTTTPPPPSTTPTAPPTTTPTPPPSTTTAPPPSTTTAPPPSTTTAPPTTTTTAPPTTTTTAPPTTTTTPTLSTAPTAPPTTTTTAPPTTTTTAPPTTTTTAPPTTTTTPTPSTAPTAPPTTTTPPPPSTTTAPPPSTTTAPPPTTTTTAPPTTTTTPPPTTQNPSGICEHQCTTTGATECLVDGDCSRFVYCQQNYLTNSFYAYQMNCAPSNDPNYKLIYCTKENRCVDRKYDIKSCNNKCISTALLKS